MIHLHSQGIRDRRNRGDDGPANHHLQKPVAIGRPGADGSIRAARALNSSFFASRVANVKRPSKTPFKFKIGLVDEISIVCSARQVRAVKRVGVA